jgi:hypothetical protein
MTEASSVGSAETPVGNVTTRAGGRDNVKGDDDELTRLYFLANGDLVNVRELITTHEAENSSIRPRTRAIVLELPSLDQAARGSDFSTVRKRQILFVATSVLVLLRGENRR